MAKKSGLFSHLSYQYKFSLMFILFGIVLTFLSGIIIYFAEKSSLENNFFKSVEYEMAGKENSVKWFLRDVQNSLNALTSNSQNPKSINRDEYINTFLEITANIAGITVLDKGKVEKIYGHSPFINEMLKRYAKKQPEIEMLKGIAVLDTFKEPIEPQAPFMLLVTQSPLFEGKTALVAVNMDSLINVISKSQYSDLSIIDRNGRYLVDRDRIGDSESRENFFKRFPETADDIFFSDIYVGPRTYAKKVLFSNREFLVMLEMDSRILQDKKETLYKYGLLIFFLIVVISLPLAYLFSIIPDRLNRKISEQKNLFETLSAHSLAGVFLYQNRFLYTNPHFSEFTGYDAEEAKCVRVEQLFREPFEEFGEKYKETRIVTKDGEQKWVYVGITRTMVDNKEAYIGTIIDISELKKIQNELEYNAMTDKLTGLLNRAKFESMFEEMRLHEKRLYLLFFDIDHFKQINDTYGHNEGDEVLKRLAAILKQSVGSEQGCLFRWGGEEFIALVHDNSSEVISGLAERIRKEVEEYSFENVGRVTLSIGVSDYRQGETLQKTIERADSALYRAKESGRNKVVADV